MDRKATTEVSSSQRKAAGKDRVTGGDHLVLVLDDDPSILSSLQRLLTAHGYRVRVHLKPEDFFTTGLPAVPACLLLDNQLGAGMSGVEVHAELHRRGWDLPTVFVTAHWNVQMVVEAMREGADDFLTKPYDPAKLVEAVAQALRRARARRSSDGLAITARTLAAELTGARTRNRAPGRLGHAQQGNR